MEWYEEEVRAMEQRLRETGPLAGQVVFYGSSSMRMWDTLAADFPGVDLLNVAFGGSTMAACAWFFERLVVPCRPRSLVCYAGDNDLGDGRTPEEVVASFREMLGKIDTYFPAIPFTLLSIKPSPARWHLADRIRETNGLLRRELQCRDNSYCIDLFPAMLGSDGLPDVSLFLEDGLHVSARGYLVWKRLLGELSGRIF
ncbi:MAG: GDSL family lipase [Desulfuromonadales bacterium]|nr:MAG: GDSL family lipase [Desulfuromonadales bacterium]